MTPQEYEKYEQMLRDRGYRKQGYGLHGATYEWYKGFGESKVEEDRQAYQVFAMVYDYTKFNESKISVVYRVSVSRSVNEDVELILWHNTQTIEEAEKKAESFYQWVEMEIEL